MEIVHLILNVHHLVQCSHRSKRAAKILHDAQPRPIFPVRVSHIELKAFQRCTLDIGLVC